jgi:hypothetical protein
MRRQTALTTTKDNLTALGYSPKLCAYFLCIALSMIRRKDLQFLSQITENVRVKSLVRAS